MVKSFEQYAPNENSPLLDGSDTGPTLNDVKQVRDCNGMNSENWDFHKLMLKVGERGRFQLMVIFITALAGTSNQGHFLVYQWLIEKPAYFACEEFTPGISTGPRGRGNVCVEQCLIWNYTSDGMRLVPNAVTDLNLYCMTSVQFTLIESAFFIFYGLGGIVMGLASDKFGRKNVIVVGSSCLFITGVCFSFVSSLTMFVIVRCIIGFFTIPSRVTGIVLASELSAPSWRPLVMCIASINVEISRIIFSVLSMELVNWRHLCFYMSFIEVPAIVLGLVFLPESPRWLSVTGQSKKAVKILKRIAKSNNRTYPSGAFLQRVSEPKGRIQDLFSTGSMAQKTVELCFTYLVVSMLYYSTLMNLERFTSDYLGHKHFLIIMSIAAIFVCDIPLPFYLKLFNRKTASAVMFSLAGGFLVLSCFSIGYFRSIFGVLAIAATGVQFCVTYVRASELLPTVCRNVGYGLCNFSAGLGTILFPFIDLSENIAKWVPSLSYGCLAAVAAVLSLHLPDTRKSELPSTVNEADAMPCSWPRFEMFYRCRQNKQYSKI